MKAKGVEIRNELQKYDDLLVIDFEDTYKNQTLKTAVMHLWLKLKCFQPKFFLKVDSDVYTSAKNVVKLCENHVNSTSTIFGYEGRSGPIRNMSSKWYVTKV